MILDSICLYYNLSYIIVVGWGRRERSKWSIAIEAANEGSDHDQTLRCRRHVCIQIRTASERTSWCWPDSELVSDMQKDTGDTCRRHRIPYTISVSMSLTLEGQTSYRKDWNCLLKSWEKPKTSNSIWLQRMEEYRLTRRVVMVTTESFKTSRGGSPRPAGNTGIRRRYLV
jgi:hypothetical protein